MSGLFLPLDVNYYHDEEFIVAGPLAELLFTRGNCWIKANTRDGRIGRHQLPLFSIGIPSPRKHAQSLVSVELWTETAGGWFVPSYLKRNRSKAQIDASREIASEAGQRGAHERWHVAPDGTPSPKCPICIAERMGAPHRTAMGSDGSREDVETTEPEAEPKREPERSSSSVLTVVPDPTGPTDDDPFEQTVTIIVAALERAWTGRIAKPKAWRHATRRNTILEDGDQIRAELAAGNDPEHVALTILGYGHDAAVARMNAAAWCAADCVHGCEGDGWVRTDEGFTPCPGRTK